MGCRFLDVLDSGIRNSLYRRLNPCQRTEGYNNFYAAAAAVFDYLATGQIRPAVCVEPCQGLVLTPNVWRRVANLRALLARVLRGGHGTQLIVSGIRRPGSRFAADHAFNLVNI